MTSGLVCAHLSPSPSRSRSNRNQISRVRWTYPSAPGQEDPTGSPRTPRRFRSRCASANGPRRVSSRRSCAWWMPDEWRSATRRGGPRKAPAGKWQPPSKAATTTRARGPRAGKSQGPFARSRGRCSCRRADWPSPPVRSCACPLRAAGRWECPALRRSRQLWARWARTHAARRAAAHRGDPRADRQRSPGPHRGGRPPDSRGTGARRVPGRTVGGGGGARFGSCGRRGSTSR